MARLRSLKEISRVFAISEDAAEIEFFLKSILTKNEADEISLRWELVKLLYEGESQRAVAKKLQISLCKITRGSRELKKEPSYFKRMIERHFGLGFDK
jgi:TrpR family trp operon transcriptional repressor